MKRRDGKRTMHLTVSIDKDLGPRLRKQAVRETAKYERMVSVSEIVSAAVEEYLGYWETGIESVVLVDEPPAEAAEQILATGSAEPAQATHCEE